MQQTKIDCWPIPFGGWIITLKFEHFKINRKALIFFGLSKYN